MRGVPRGASSPRRRLEQNMGGDWRAPRSGRPALYIRIELFVQHVVLNFVVINLLYDGDFNQHFGLYSPIYILPNRCHIQLLPTPPFLES